MYLQQWGRPIEESLSQDGRGVFLIRIFQFWSVDEGISGTDSGEEDDDEDHKTKRGANGCVDGGCFELSFVRQLSRQILKNLQQGLTYCL